MVSEIYVYIYSRDIYIYWRYGLQMSSVKETMNFLKGMNEGCACLVVESHVGNRGIQPTKA